MNTYEVKVIVNGSRTNVRIQAYSSAEAKKLVLEQYAGSQARVIQTDRVRD